MKTWMYDVLIDKSTPEQTTKRKTNRKHKIAVEAIKGWLVCGNVKKAIDVAELHGIDAKEFGKIVKAVAE